MRISRHAKNNMRLYGIGQEDIMKVSYDKAVDAAYLQFTTQTPQSAIEIEEGVILHVTNRDEIVALEILDASKHLPIQNLFSLEVAEVT